MISRLRESRGPNQRRVYMIGENELVIEYVGALDQIFKSRKMLYSKVYHNNNLVSEKMIHTWSEDGEPLSELSHRITVNEDGTEAHYKIEHKSTISISPYVRRNGREIG